MKKTTIILLLLSVYTADALCQTVRIEPGKDYKPTPVRISQRDTLDHVMFCCYYKMNWVKDVEKPGQKTENEMLLQVGTTISKFFDRQKYLSDSLMAEYAGQQMDGIEATNKILGMGLRSIPLNVFKNYPEGKITTIDRIPFDSYLYEEEVPAYNWTLVNDTLTVCGYRCKKACTSLFGRSYTAWYAPDIPIDNGPWKFGGLPGLILKIEDDKGHYSFECTAIERNRRNDVIYLLKSNSRFNISKKRFWTCSENIMKILLEE